MRVRGASYPYAPTPTTDLELAAEPVGDEKLVDVENKEDRHLG